MMQRKLNMMRHIFMEGQEHLKTLFEKVVKVTWEALREMDPTEVTWVSLSVIIHNKHFLSSSLFSTHALWLPPNPPAPKPSYLFPHSEFIPADSSSLLRAESIFHTTQRLGQHRTSSQRCPTNMWNTHKWRTTAFLAVLQVIFKQTSGL